MSHGKPADEKRDCKYSSVGLRVEILRREVDVNGEVALPRRTAVETPGVENTLRDSSIESELACVRSLSINS
jgi:hypothetical protein